MALALHLSRGRHSSVPTAKEIPMQKTQIHQSCLNNLKRLALATLVIFGLQLMACGASDTPDDSVATFVTQPGNSVAEESNSQANTAASSNSPTVEGASSDSATSPNEEPATGAAPASTAKHPNNTAELSGFGCPGNEKECHQHCRSIGYRGGYCKWQVICKCYG